MFWILLVSQAFAADCPADFDGDDLVDGYDLHVLLGQWNGSGEADLDDNGVVNAVDLTLLLNDWGECPEDFACGQLLVDDRDGQTYTTRAYGPTCWMTENLNYGERIDSDDTGSLATDDDVVQKFCYGDDPAVCDTNGGLYSWQEATAFEGSSNRTPSGLQGACPDGWHLPSDAEYQDLERFLGMAEDDVLLFEEWRGDGIGTNMKVGGSSGFEGQLSGWRDAVTGDYVNRNFYGGFWSATASDDKSTEFPEAINRGLLFPYNTVGRFAYDRRASLSLRCVSDLLDDEWDS